MQVNSGNNPLITVVIPVHNGERYISHTINSVLEQSYSEFELIIINDGSVDSTDKIISEYQTNDNRIKIIHQVKSGVATARNKGLHLAKGKYITFLDADDIWLKDNLLDKVDFLNQKINAFGVTSYCELINENNQTSGIIQKGDEKVFLKDLLQWKGNYITIPSGILFRTEIMRQTGGFNTGLSNNADQEIIMRLLHLRFTFHTIPNVTWYYRKHGNNMSSNVDLMEQDTIKCYQLADENGYFDSLIFKGKCMSRMSMILALSFWRNGNNRVKSLKWMLKSFLFSPVNFIGQVIDRLLKLDKTRIESNS